MSSRPSAQEGGEGKYWGTSKPFDPPAKIRYHSRLEEAASRLPKNRTAWTRGQLMRNRFFHNALVKCEAPAIFFRPLSWPPAAALILG